MPSIITTAPSTMIPKSIAPRDIKLPESSVACMGIRANSIESGMAAETISPPRRLPSRSSSTSTTKTPPSIKFVATVRMVRLTSRVRL